MRAAPVPDVAGEAWHGVRAWRYFRRHPGYRAAWAAEAGAPVFEAAPFAVRVQSPADLGAARFGLLAWEDPFDAAGPASPFWSEALAVPAVPACDAAGAVCTANGTPLSYTAMATVPGPVAISVADAEADEAEDASVDFIVSLNRAATSAVSVDYPVAA